MNLPAVCGKIQSRITAIHVCIRINREVGKKNTPPQSVVLARTFSFTRTYDKTGVIAPILGSISGRDWPQYRFNTDIGVRGRWASLLDAHVDLPLSPLTPPKPCLPSYWELFCVYFERTFLSRDVYIHLYIPDGPRPSPPPERRMNYSSHIGIDRERIFGCETVPERIVV